MNPAEEVREGFPFFEVPGRETAGPGLGAASGALVGGKVGGFASTWT